MNRICNYFFLLILGTLMSCSTKTDEIKFGDSIDDVKTLVKSSDKLNIESEYGAYPYQTLIISGGFTMLGHEWSDAECSFSNGKLDKVELKDKSEDVSYVENVKEELVKLCGEEKDGYLLEKDEGEEDLYYGKTDNTSGYVGHLYVNKNNGKVRVHVQSHNQDLPY